MTELTTFVAEIRFRGYDNDPTMTLEERIMAALSTHPTLSFPIDSVVVKTVPERGEFPEKSSGPGDQAADLNMLPAGGRGGSLPTTNPGRQFKFKTPS